MVTDSGHLDHKHSTRLPFGETALSAISAELGVNACAAAYRLGDNTIWEFHVPTKWLPGATLLVVLWPTLSRVDARVVLGDGGPTPLAVTAKQVHTVEVYEGVEVMFRRHGGSVMFVTRDGHIAMAD